MPAPTPAILTTPRLILRPLEEGDAAAQFALYGDAQVTRYGAHPAWTDIEEARAAIREAQAGYADGSALRLAVCLREGGAMIGNGALYDFHAASRRADIGYSLLPAHWGHGYLREALTALIAHGFGALDLNRIEADADPRNTASIKALESLGFRREGYLPQRWIVAGEVCDTVFFGLLREYWFAR